jgi:DNA-binding NtrC family response regulator
MPKVLIIDDNPAVALALEVLLSLHDIESVTATTPDIGLTLLSQQVIDLVIQDMNFSADTTSGEEGMELFRQIRQRCPDMPVILLTAWTHLDAAVGLIKAGAADYMGKPWNDQRLLTVVRNLIELGQANRACNVACSANASVSKHWKHNLICVAWCGRIVRLKKCWKLRVRLRVRMRQS